MVGGRAALIVWWALVPALGSRAYAQIALDQYRPATVATDGFAVPRTEAPPHGQIDVGVQLAYASQVLKLRVPPSTDAREEVAVVSRQLTDHLTLAVGVHDRGVLTLQVPVVLLLEGESLVEGAPEAGFGGVGDLALGGRYRLTRGGGPVELAARAVLRAPTARALNDAQRYVGERLGSYDAGLVADMDRGRLSVHAALGARMRGRTRVGVLRVGSELSWGAGLYAQLSSAVTAHLEAFGASDFRGRQTSPAEALVGLRFQYGGALIGAAGGAGVLAGYGTPRWRAVLQLGFAPVEPPPPPPDGDGDGLPDGEDRCPDQAEDPDGNQDWDGCPDDDDGDGIPDEGDRCRHTPEDLDGFADGDGCPDLDDDRDGVPDAQDPCPRVPGDGQGGRAGCAAALTLTAEGHIVLSRAPALDPTSLAPSPETRAALHLLRVVRALNPQLGAMRWLVYGPAAQRDRLGEQAEALARRLSEQLGTQDEASLCPAEGAALRWELIPLAAPAPPGCEPIVSRREP